MLIRLFLCTFLFSSLNALNGANAVEYGIVAERSSSAVDKNIEVTQDSEIKLSLKGLETSFDQHSFLAPDIQAAQKFSKDSVYQENEEMYEFIGMFISDYKSTQNVRIKLKMTRKAELNQASLNWKIRF